MIILHERPTADSVDACGTEVGCFFPIGSPSRSFVQGKEGVSCNSPCRRPRVSKLEREVNARMKAVMMSDVFSAQ